MSKKEIIFILLLFNIFSYCFSQTQTNNTLYITFPNISILDIEKTTDPIYFEFEAGLDFTGEYESSYNQEYLQINHPGKWKLKVHKNEIYWHEKLKLMIRSTGDGIGPGQIGGVEGYQDLKVTPDELSNGEKDHFAVPLQFLLKDVSVLLPAENYSVDVVYTLIDD